MNERHCEYCGHAATSTSPGGLQACTLHHAQPGTTPLYDSVTGAPLTTGEWTADRRAAQWKAQAEGNARRAARPCEYCGTVPSLGVNPAGLIACDEHWAATAADLDRRNGAKFNNRYRGCEHGDCQRGSIGIDHSGAESCREHWVSSPGPGPS